MKTERQEWRYSWIKLQKAMMSLNKYVRCTFQVKMRCRCLYVNASEGNRMKGCDGGRILPPRCNGPTTAGGAVL